MQESGEVGVDGMLFDFLAELRSAEAHEQEKVPRTKSIIRLYLPPYSSCVFSVALAIPLSGAITNFTWCKIPVDCSADYCIKSQNPLTKVDQVVRVRP